MNSTQTPTQPPADAWDSADPLGETLHTLKINGVVYAQSYLTAPWGVDLPPMPNCLMFHVVTAGQCLIRFPDGETAQLNQGDFVLVPHGQGHELLNHAKTRTQPFFDLPIQRISQRYETLHWGGGGTETQILCGAVKFDHPAGHDLVQLLPRLIHIDTFSGDQGEWMHSSLRWMGMEARELKAGGEAIITRLADILVIQAIRHWLNSHAEAQTGWIGALQDEQIGQAILLIQREPEGDWTVPRLAEEVSMSRSAFSAKFTQLVGESPAHYLTRWRMHMAGMWLRENRFSLMECALRLGYQSEAAFNRAFKRVVGVTPGQWKKQSKDDLS